MRNPETVEQPCVCCAGTFDLFFAQAFYLEPKHGPPFKYSGARGYILTEDGKTWLVDVLMRMKFLTGTPSPKPIPRPRVVAVECPECRGRGFVEYSLQKGKEQP